MIKKSKHTPFPWKLKESVSGNHFIYSLRDEKPLAGISKISPTRTVEESEANAEFIFRAAVNHEDLLDLCKSLMIEIFGTDNPVNANHPLAIRGINVIANAEKIII